MIFQETFWENFQPENPLLHIRQAGVVHGDPSYAIQRSGSMTNVIGYIRSGALVEKAGGRTLRLCQGDCYLLPYGTEYEIHADKDHPPVIKWLNIRGSLFNSILDSLFGCGTFPWAPYEAEGLIDEIGRLLRAEEDRFQEIARLIFRLLLELRAAGEAGKSLREAEEDLAQRYDAYICKNIQHPFSAKKMAEDFGVSPETLNRTFRREWGETPYQYYQSVRISLAQSLLKNTQLTIEDIAGRLNFTDRNYFSLYFKKRTGCSPARYRKTWGSA